MWFNGDGPILVQYKKSSENQVWVEKLQQIEPIKGLLKLLFKVGVQSIAPSNIHYLTALPSPKLDLRLALVSKTAKLWGFESTLPSLSTKRGRGAYSNLANTIESYSSLFRKTIICDHEVTFN